MHVVRPPWTTATSQAARWRESPWTYAAHLDALGAGERAGVDARAADDDHAQPGDARARLGERVDHALRAARRRRPSRRP